MADLPTKRFTKRNEGFRCVQCEREVPPGTKGTIRNHCPYCLFGMHIDDNPGDRQASCGGRMKPIGAFYKGGKAHIQYRCQRCGLERPNQAAEAPCAEPDNRDLIFALMRKASLTVRD